MLSCCQASEIYLSSLALLLKIFLQQEKKDTDLIA